MTVHYHSFRIQVSMLAREDLEENVGNEKAAERVDDTVEGNGG